jgi:hypothetical protein
MELRGDVHGGRFVNGYAGEQFALPSVPNLLKAASLDYESKGPAEPSDLCPADPLAPGTLHDEAAQGAESKPLQKDLRPGTGL